MEGVFISMRLCHPTLDVKAMCEKFGLKPKRAWLSGELKQTSKGAALQETYADSYCACDLPFDHAEYFEDGLRLVAEILKPHALTLNEFSQDGGRISLFISLEKGVFQGAEIKPGVLAELAALHMTLEIDRNL